MRFSLKSLVTSLLLPLAVAGCASFPGTTDYLDELKTTQPTGPAFTQALAGEYLAFAESQKGHYDWYDSWYFARKGLDASRGTLVAPEQPNDWSISDKQALADLIAARTDLVAALSSPAAARLPKVSATAQVKFDCWVEEQSEGWENDLIKACRDDFRAALDLLKPQPEAVTPPSPPAAVPVDKILFDTNRYALNAAGKAEVKRLAALAKAKGYPALTIIGHTDTVGGSEYNKALAGKRATMVRKALIAQGVPADKLAIDPAGKSKLLVNTGDNIAEQQNRAVTIQPSLD